MRFRGRKIYGQSKTATCPFCQKLATTKNEQGLEVCYQHTKEVLPEIKCTCGSWLESRVGKFGPYFNCLNCGNVNYNKAMEIKSITMKQTRSQPVRSSSKYGSSARDSAPAVDKAVIPKQTATSYARNKETHVYGSKKRKEITITSDDVDYFS